MRNHTLMQTIARANRVFPGKHSGVIVDYANVFASLEKALAIYGKGKGGANPVKDKAELVAALREAIGEATAFCVGHGVDLAAMEALPAGGLERLQAVEDAIEALIAPEERRREFFGHEKLVGTLYRAIKPDPTALEFAERVAGILALAAAVRTRLSPDPPDITEVMGQISGLLDESIAGLTIREAGPPPIDLSKINFEALAQRFKASTHKNTEIEALKAAIRARLDRLLQRNRTRIDFAEKFEELIESYNAGSRNIEQLFEELLKLSNSLDEEDERHVRENLAEEELVIFDILTRPAPELSAEERDEIKKVVRDMLTKLKALLVLNWRQKSSARSQLRWQSKTRWTLAFRVPIHLRSTSPSARRSSNTCMRLTPRGIRACLASRSESHLTSGLVCPAHHPPGSKSPERDRRPCPSHDRVRSRKGCHQARGRKEHDFTPAQVVGEWGQRVPCPSGRARSSAG